MKFFKSVFAMYVISSMAISCVHEPLVTSKKPDPIVPKDTTFQDKDTCIPGRVYFINDVLPIFQSSCMHNGCHSGPDPQKKLNMGVYTDILSIVEPGNPSKSELVEVITDPDPLDRMPEPPYDALTSEQINVIKKWIQQGAINDSCNRCSPDSSRFAAHILPIFRDNCRSCHSGSSPSGGIPLTVYNEILPLALNGKILGAIKHDANYKPMPDGNPKLKECQIAQIEKWINDGALNN